MDVAGGARNPAPRPSSPRPSSKAMRDENHMEQVMIWNQVAEAQDQARRHSYSTLRSPGGSRRSFFSDVEGARQVTRTLVSERSSNKLLVKHQSSFRNSLPALGTLPGASYTSRPMEGSFPDRGSGSFARMSATTSKDTLPASSKDPFDFEKELGAEVVEVEQVSRQQADLVRGRNSLTDDVDLSPSTDEDSSDSDLTPRHSKLPPRL